MTTSTNPLQDWLLLPCTQRSSGPAATERSPRARGWGWEELTLSDCPSTSLLTDLLQALSPLPAPLPSAGSCSPLQTMPRTAAVPVKLILSEVNHQEPVCALSRGHRIQRGAGTWMSAVLVM